MMLKERDRDCTPSNGNKGKFEGYSIILRRKGRQPGRPRQSNNCRGQPLELVDVENASDGIATYQSDKQFDYGL